MSTNPAGREAAAQDPVPRSAHTGLTVQFYHLTATPVERALPKLLEKALASGNRVLVVESRDDRRDYFNQMLWTYSTLTFLPHGAANDPAPEEQPILLSPAAENVNGAKMALVTDGTLLAGATGFERILDMFDGNDAEAVEQARGRWAAYKNAGHALTYMRQNAAGGWDNNFLPLEGGGGERSEPVGVTAATRPPS